MSEWLSGVLAAERLRWPLWLPVGFGTGVGLYFALPAEPAAWAPPAAAALAGAAAWLLRRRPAIALFPLAAAVVAAGIATADLRTTRVAAPILGDEHGPAWVRGEVVSVEPRPHGHRVVVAVDEIGGLEAPERPQRVRINIRTGPPPPPGRRIAVLAVLLPPPSPVAPGAFDFARALYFQRIGAVGYAVGKPRDDGGARAGGVRQRLAALRLAIAETIEETLTEGRTDDPTWRQRAPVASALLTGLRGGIDEQVLEWLRDAGLAHLLAISGLHLGLVAGFAFVGVRLVLASVEPVALRYPIKKWAALVAVAAAFGYLLLTGGTVPTQRAFIMTAMVLVAVTIDREPITMRPVAWAAVLVLALRPESLTGASFQMSFAAVTALVAFYEVVRHRTLRRVSRPPLWQRPLLYVGAVVATTIVASLATAPFAAFHFNHVSLFGLVANLVAVPVTALWIMPCGVAALLLMPLGLHAPALEAMGWGIGTVIAVARTSANLPFAVTLVPAMPTSAFVALVLGGLWLVLWRRRWRFLGVVAGCSAAVWIVATARGPDLLVNEDGSLFAVRAASGELALSSPRSRSFTAASWLRRAGQTESAPWPMTHMACDRLGCLYAPERTPRVALVRDARALAEDCAVADIVVSAVPTRGTCSAPLVVDRFDLWRNGAYAIRFDDGTGRPQAVHARGARGARPWAPPRQ